MSEPRGQYWAPGYGPHPGQPGYGEPIPSYEPPQNYGYGPPVVVPSAGTVITAAVIQIIQASLFALGGAAILLLAGLVNSAGDEVGRRSGSDVSRTTDTLSHLVAIAGMLLILGAIVMIGLAALAIRGRRWAATTSIVLQVLAVVGGLSGLSRSETHDNAAAGVVFVCASIAVVVLFLLPASTEYFAARAAAASR